MSNSKQQIVFRKGSLTEDVYLQKDGTWGAYDTAKRFSASAADEQEAKFLREGFFNFGTFAG